MSEFGVFVQDQNMEAIVVASMFSKSLGELVDEIERVIIDPFIARTIESVFGDCEEDSTIDDVIKIMKKTYKIFATLFLVFLIYKAFLKRK